MCVVELTMTLGWCVLYSHPSQWVMEGGVQVLCKIAEARNTNHERPQGTVMEYRSVACLLRSGMLRLG
jgi:hypothetical protein